MRTTKIDMHDPCGLPLMQVASALRCGAVVALPTDTVYGMAVLVSPSSVPERLYTIKGRDAGKAIACLVAGIEALSIYVEDVPSYAFALAERYWPGALTLVLKASPRIPPAFRAADGSVALRVPAHPFDLALLGELGAPLATTSANISGKPPALSAAELAPELVAQVELVIDDGSLGSGLPSTIISCLGPTPQVVRVGALSVDGSML